jgi:hypothetical protein
MSDRQFELAVLDWLEDGSDRTPPAAIDGVLLAVKTTPQERDLRIPWRFTRMTTMMRLAAGIALIAVLGIGALQLLRPTSNVGTTPTPSPTTAPAAPTELPSSALVPFASSVYGYTISVIKGWGAVVATRTLHGTEPLYGNDPQINTPAADSIMGGFDAIQTGPTGRLLIAGSPTPAGMNLASWTTATTVAKCGPPTSQAAITIDGETATLTTYFGGQACFGLSQQWVTVIHGGWAWNIVWIDNQGSETADAFFFQQILGTFRFGQVPATSPAPS